jgi:hypothetical protein
MFAAQTLVNRPVESHTWGAFVRETPIPNSQESELDDANIISWLPRTLVIEPFGGPEPGTNLDLPTTLKWAFEVKNRNVYAWGPFEIKEMLLEHAAERASQLEGGSVEYVMIDDAFFGSRPNKATNCIHAVSDLDLTSQLLFTGVEHGRSASQAVLNYFKRHGWVINPRVVHPDIATRLDLDKYPDIKWNQ